MSLADDFDSIDAAPKKGAAPAASSSAKPAASATPSSLADQFDATPTTAAAQKAPSSQKPGASQPHESTPLDIAGAAVEPLATLATGAIGGLVGGVARLGSAAVGSSYDDAKATGNKLSDMLTYHPQTQGGQQALAGLGDMATSAKNAVMQSPVGPAISAAGKAYDNTFVKGGQGPLMATVNDMVPGVTANLVGGKLASAALDAATAAPNALRAAIAKPAAPAARVEPSMGGQPGAGFQDASRPQSTMYTGADGTTSTTPPGGQSAPPRGAGFMGAGGPAPAAAGGRGSVGAAGTSFADQARAEGVPDHLVQKIAEGEKAGTLNPTAAERHIEAGSLPVPVDLTAGQATGDINLLSHEQNIRGKVPELADRFNAQNGQIAANFDAIRDKVAPDVHAPAGQALDQAIVDAYKAHDAPIQEDIASKYKALEDANGGQFPLNGTDFVNSATSALNAQSKAYSHFLPSKVSNMLSDFKDSGSMNFNDFESMRTILANEARKASAAGDGNAAHAINIVRNSLESLPMTNETAALKPLADAARAAAKARFDAMGADPAYAAAVNDGVASGSPSPAADGFFRKYVVQGKSANVQNMLNTLSSDPTNAQLLAAGMIDHVKAQSGLDLRTGAGNVSQAGLNKALTNLKDKPGIVLGPEASQTLERLGNVARYTQEQPRGSYVNNSNTFVAGAANATKSALEGAANVAAHGVPVGTWARQALAKRAIGKEAAQSLEPGAGLNKLHSAMGGRR